MFFTLPGDGAEVTNWPENVDSLQIFSSSGFGSVQLKIGRLVERV